jgi:hypothetical protein
LGRQILVVVTLKVDFNTWVFWTYIRNRHRPQPKCHGPKVISH